MDRELFHYLKRHSVRTGERFLRCNGVVYEAEQTHYRTGPSPLWTIAELQITTVPDFVRDPHYYKGE